VSSSKAANSNMSSHGHEGTAKQIVDDYERLEVADHPFFRELKERPVDYDALWLLMANLQCSISHHFVRWLAGVISRLDDPRIASLLAKQLNDELGNGDYKAIHSVLLERFVSGLGEKSQLDVRRDWLRPGRGLMASMTTTFSASDPYEAVGALMVSEIFAKKMDHCVGEELRRQNALSRETMHWLDLHEQLEVAHAEDSYELAVLVPERGPQLKAAWRGAQAEWDALWSFLDEVHAASRAERAA
jgi:pyrroloquinoline quinone (PQQ) biosynthesis protein C